MRIISLNLNGIRAACRKGFAEWLPTTGADVVCLQETKAQIHQLGPAITAIPGYESFFLDAEKPGYSGVAIYTRQTPDRIHRGLGWDDCDAEGRYIQADFGRLSVASVYLPSGTSGDVRQQFKFRFLDRFREDLKRFRRKRREFVLCGDWNIAHKEIDLRNWRSNQKNSGFLPEERAWLTTIFETDGWVDAFRAINQQPDQYTWWSNRGQAWARNVGWRIDYHVVTPGLAEAIRADQIYKDQRFSDHAPLIIDYDL